MGGTGVSSPAAGVAALLERERELASLQELVEAAAAGEGRLAILEGPAGIGKTRLLAEARRRAADAGLRVLTARGGELEREFPFGVVRQLFEPLLVGDDARERLLVGAAAPASTRSRRSGSVTTASNSWRTTPNGNSRSSSEPRAASTCAPASAAWRRSSASSVLLPIPAGPSIQATRPSPSGTASSSAASAATSRSRSTRGVMRGRILWRCRRSRSRDYYTG